MSMSDNRKVAFEIVYSLETQGTKYEEYKENVDMFLEDRDIHGKATTKYIKDVVYGTKRHAKQIKKQIESLLKQTYKNIDKYFNNSNDIFFKFIASQFLDAIVVGVLVTIAMSLMEIKYAPLLGFFIGLFNMIPYIGAIIAVAISALVTLITGGLSQTIWMLIVVIILQQIDANIINPRIVGQSLKISPLLVIFAVTVGGAYFGILGMFLAVPIVAVLKILVEDYINYRLKLKEINNKDV